MANWQLVQVTYKVSVYMANVCGKRQVGKGAHSIYSGCSCSRWVYTFVLFIVVRVQVNTHSSLYTKLLALPFKTKCLNSNSKNV